jgi:hypothetical protein
MIFDEIQPDHLIFSSSFFNLATCPTSLSQFLTFQINIVRIKPHVKVILCEIEEKNEKGKEK